MYKEEEGWGGVVSSKLLSAICFPMGGGTFYFYFYWCFPLKTFLYILFSRTLSLQKLEDDSFLKII